MSQPIITPLIAEEMHGRDLDKELHACVEELLRLVARYEELREAKARNVAALREMKKTRHWGAV